MELRNLPPSDGFDDDLQQRVRRFLDRQGHKSLRSLEVKVDQGAVRVKGRLPTFYLRQVAIACIKHVAGVAQIIDMIDVDNPIDHPPVADSATAPGDVLPSSVNCRLDLPEPEATSEGEKRHGGATAAWRQRLACA